MCLQPIAWALYGITVTQLGTDNTLVRQRECSVYFALHSIARRP